MRNKFIMGKYIDTGSWVHRLDPRSRVTAMLLFMAVIFMINSFVGVAAVSIFAIVMMGFTKIPYKVYSRAVKPLMLLIGFIALFQMIFNTGGTRIVSMGSVHLYTGGLEQGALSALRMILFITFTAILTFTTTPERLTHGLEHMFAPLRYLRMSPQKITLMISIALRFIPSIFEEAEKIVKAQASRGFVLKERTLREKASILMTLLVPVSVGAFRRAMDLVDSMESRGYQLGMPRSKFQQLLWGNKDTLFVMAFALLVVLMVYLRM
jgi:energy-coupling factor transport system permease protein